MRRWGGSMIRRMRRVRSIRRGSLFWRRSYFVMLVRGEGKGAGCEGGTKWGDGRERGVEIFCKGKMEVVESRERERDGKEMEYLCWVSLTHNTYERNDFWSSEMGIANCEDGLGFTLHTHGRVFHEGECLWLIPKYGRMGMGAWIWHGYGYGFGMRKCGISFGVLVVSFDTYRYNDMI
ncbi:hypothetical protein EYC80_002465 [Monilinia laxa]|uniref:Uncharacterized protein n=1 Tax=Monilinia laxa TaxID=61186 RepID=A0A5N6K3Z7_MONLA|nr:hypothetical protein EYC80_002465 [Monilinia laxa]